jgi:tRNA 2-thiouridine synthesizing protein A
MSELIIAKASSQMRHELDAQGLFCPEPVMLLHHLIREMQDGEIVHVLATDPSTRRDIPKFCQFLGHALVETAADPAGQVFHYVIRKCAASHADGSPQA